MERFLRKNAQAIIIAILAFIIMYRPTFWYTYFMDYIVCCWALNALYTWTKGFFDDHF